MIGKKSNKCTLIVIAIASSICLFSFGFSTFIIGEEAGQKSTDIQFNYGDVIISSDYLSLNTAKGDGTKLPYTGINMFNYNSSGFVVNETVMFSTFITYYVRFDVVSFYKNYSKNIVNFSLNLSYANASRDNYALLSSNYFDKSSSSVKYYRGTSGSYFSSATINTGISNENFLIDNINKKISFSFTYEFTPNDYANTNTMCRFEFKFSFNANDKASFDYLYNNEFRITDSNLEQSSYRLSVGINYED